MGVVPSYPVLLVEGLYCVLFKGRFELKCREFMSKMYSNHSYPGVAPILADRVVN